MTLSRFAFALLLLGSAAVIAEEPSKDSKAPQIVDPNGRLAVPKKWKIVAGPQQISFLGKPMEVFPVREFGSTNYRDGVLTYIPMARLQSIAYDYEKSTATFTVAGADKPVQGSTQFTGINAITVEAEVDRGMGIVDIRYRGGAAKGGFKEIKFPDAKAPDIPHGKGSLFSFMVVPEGKGKSGTLMTATNVKALYRMGDGSDRLLNWVMLKKTLKVELDSVTRMHLSDYKVNDRTAECDVTLKDGMQLSATLLSNVMIEDKPATLIGLLGEVPVGWKLFPVHTISDFQPGEMKVEEKKIEPKKKDPPKKVDEPGKKDEPAKKADPK